MWFSQDYTKIISLEVFHSAFASSFILSFFKTGHDLPGKKKNNCVISSLVFFLCPDWYGYFHLKQVCIIHRGVPFMEEMLPMRFWQTRRTLNDSSGAWTVPVSSHSIQNWLSSDTVPSVSFTEDWMSGLPFTNACLIFFFFLLCPLTVMRLLDPLQGPSTWWNAVCYHLSKAGSACSGCFVCNKKTRRQWFPLLCKPETLWKLAGSQFWFLF